VDGKVQYKLKWTKGQTGVGGWEAGSKNFANGERIAIGIAIKHLDLRP
jgi:hypothetical protein